ncbi:MAG: cytochrome c [Gammaproteobacteria bacterium]|nr:cytochrome c [Gammaproteobacteria bacterium]
MRLEVFVAGALVIGGVQAGGLDEDRRAELDHLLRHECGSCHGLRLEGGLGPALTPERMRKRSAEYLRAAIREGIPGTAMPPWESLLSDADIVYLAAALQGERP